MKHNVAGRIIILIFSFILFCQTGLFAEKDTRSKIESDLKMYFQAFSERKWDEMMNYCDPRLFKDLSKEALIGNIKANDDFGLKICADVNKTVGISKIVESDGEKICLLWYITDYIIYFENHARPLYERFITKYKPDNYHSFLEMDKKDDSCAQVEFKMVQSAIATSSDGGESWKFIDANNTQRIDTGKQPLNISKTFRPAVLPDEITGQFAPDNERIEDFINNYSVFTEPDNNYHVKDYLIGINSPKQKKGITFNFSEIKNIEFINMMNMIVKNKFMIKPENTEALSIPVFSLKTPRPISEPSIPAATIEIVEYLGFTVIPGKNMYEILPRKIHVPGKALPHEPAFQNYSVTNINIKNSPIAEISYKQKIKPGEKTFSVNAANLPLKEFVYFMNRLCGKNIAIIDSFNLPVSITSRGVFPLKDAQTVLQVILHHYGYQLCKGKYILMVEPILKEYSLSYTANKEKITSERKTSLAATLFVNNTDQYALFCNHDDTGRFYYLRKQGEFIYTFDEENSIDYTIENIHADLVTLRSFGNIKNLQLDFNEYNSDVTTSRVPSDMPQIRRLQKDRIKKKADPLRGLQFAPFIANGRVKGVKLLWIDEGNILDLLGLKEYDILVSYNSNFVNDTRSLMKFIDFLKKKYSEPHPDRQPVEIVAERNGNKIVLRCFLDKEEPESADVQSQEEINFNILEGLRAGPNISDGEFNGYKIFDIIEANYLFKAGVRKGDILISMNVYPISSTEDLYNALKEFIPKKKIIIKAYRDGNEITLEYTIPADNSFMNANPSAPREMPAEETTKNDVKKIPEISSIDIDSLITGIPFDPDIIPGGEIDGIKVSPVLLQSLMVDIGVINGDIIKKINGARIDSRENFFKAVDRVRSEKKIRLEIENYGFTRTVEKTLLPEDVGNDEGFAPENAAEYYLRGISKLSYPMNFGNSDKSKTRFEEMLNADWNEESESFLDVIEKNMKGINYFLKGSALPYCDFNVKKEKYQIHIDREYVTKAYSLCNIAGYYSLYKLHTNDIDTSVMINNRILDFAVHYYHNMEFLSVLLGMRIENLYMNTLKKQIATGKMTPKHYRAAAETLSKYLSKRFTTEQIVASEKKKFEENIEMIADNLPADNLSKEEAACRLEMISKYHSEKKRISDTYFPQLREVFKTNNHDDWEKLEKETNILTEYSDDKEYWRGVMSNIDILKFFLSNSSEKNSILTRSVVEHIFIITRLPLRGLEKYASDISANNKKLSEIYESVKSKTE